MKRFIFATIAASATIIIAAGCQDMNEMAPTETNDRNVITASIPEAITKVSMNVPEDGKGLALAWEAEDQLTVIGESTGQFTIAEGFSPHNAQFNGTAVNGEEFIVLYPGQTYKTVEDINSVSYLNQTQKGNNNTDHLFYHAIVETSDYTSLDFAEAKQNGVIKFLFQLPSGATEVESVTLSATDAIFYATNDLEGDMVNALTLNLEGVDVSESEQMLTAYMMISWNDVALAGNSKLTITVNMPDSKFEQALTVPEGGLTILSGKVNTFGLNNESWTEPLFFGGSGTESDPYQIKTFAHLDNVRKKLVKDAETMVYFKMVDDIDMSDQSWTMYNGSTGNVYKYDFDGNGHTISNFSMTRSGASFFGALTGGSKIHDLKFEDVSLTGVEEGGNSVATVSYNVNDGTIDNVDISKINITPLTNTGTGAIAAKLTQGAISNCDVTDLTITGTHQRIGGIVGTTEGSYVNKIEYCTVSSSTINGGWATGGIIGIHSSSGKLSVSNCTVSGKAATPTVVKSSSSSVGGIIGEGQKAIEVTDCKAAYLSVSTTKSSDKSYCGGIAGLFKEEDSSLTRCSLTDTSVDAGNTLSVGGILGYATKTCTITQCTVSNAANSAMITGAACVGGVIGEAAETVTLIGCEVVSKISALGGDYNKDFTSVGLAGGIIGYAAAGGSMTNNGYSGTLSSSGTGANDAVGGIIGYTAKFCTITECTTSNAEISGSYRVAGIVGRVTGSDKTNRTLISGCKVKDNVSITASGAYVGGIVGRNHAGAGLSVSSCIVNASLSCTNTDSDNYIGGVIGDTGGAVKVEKCCVTGNLTGKHKRIGGIIGSMPTNVKYDASDISECAYLGGQITGTTQLGGIVGVVTTAAKISNCYSISGSIKGTGYTGGIVGNYTGTIVGDNTVLSLSDCHVSNCFSTMDNNTEEGNSNGGLIGCFGPGSETNRKTSNSGSVTACIAWNGKVLASNTTNSGCVIGAAGWYSTLADCYRNPEMELGLTKISDSENVSSTVPATASPYHGKAAGAEETVSSIAENTLGWSGEIWDFSEDLPTLKNLPK